MITVDIIKEITIDQAEGLIGFYFSGRLIKKVHNGEVTRFEFNREVGDPIVFIREEKK